MQHSLSVRAAVAIVLATIGLLLAGIPMFMHPPTGYTGLHVGPGPTRGQLRVASVDAGSPAARSGLRTGDIIGCLSYRDARFVSPDIYSGRDYGTVPGTPVELCVARAGIMQPAAIVPQPRSPAPSLYGNDAGAAFRLAEYAIFLLAGVLLVYGRPGLMSWMYLCYAIGTAPNAMGYINLTILPSAWYMAYVVGCQAVDFASPGFLLMFTLLVPDGRAVGWRRSAFALAAVLTAATVAYNLVLPLAMEINAEAYATRLPEAVLAILTIITVAVRLFTMSPELRTRFGWAAFGIVWGVVTIAIAHRSISLGDGAGIVAALLSVVMPVALLYAVLRQHLIDLRFVLSRTIVFAAITTSVVGIIGLVDWLSAQYLHESRAATVIDAGVTIALAFVLHRTYRWIEEAVDFLLFRKKYEAENYLRRLAHSLLSAASVETVDRELVDAPYAMLDLTTAILYRSTSTGFHPYDVRGTGGAPDIGTDDELVLFLKTDNKAVSLNELRRLPSGLPSSAIAIAIPRGRTVAAFVIYGAHRAGTALDPDEVDVLEHLCDAAGRAYVNIDLAQFAVNIPARA